MNFECLWVPAGASFHDSRVPHRLDTMNDDGTAPHRSTIARFALVCLPFGAGYFLSYLYRSINAVIGPPIAFEFELGAGDLGLLTSVYFLGFGLFQLPLGILLDRYGPRRVQFALLIVATVGAVIFSAAQSFSLLTVGRALIGIGFAGGLMASFKAITVWFPRRRWPLLNGLIMGFAASGRWPRPPPSNLRSNGPPGGTCSTSWPW